MKAVGSDASMHRRSADSPVQTGIRTQPNPVMTLEIHRNPRATRP